MALIRAADSAYFHPMSELSADVKIVCGYIGQPGYTPHVWTKSEIDAVHQSGREWWAIWVPPQKIAWTAALGHSAASGAIAALPAYGIPKSVPVFIDCEYNSWALSPSGAKAAIDAFKADLHVAGYSQVFGYVPSAAGYDWIARWTGSPPTSFPAGVIGQQYINDVASGTNWDFSMFDSALYEADPIPTPPSQDWFDMATKQDLIDVLTSQSVKEAISHQVREDIWGMLNNRSGHDHSMGDFWSGLATYLAANPDTFNAISAAVARSVNGPVVEGVSNLFDSYKDDAVVKISHRVRDDVWGMLNKRSGKDASMSDFWHGLELYVQANPDIAAAVGQAVVSALNAAGSDKQLNGMANGIIDHANDRGYNNTLQGIRRGVNPNYNWPPTPADGSAQ